MEKGIREREHNLHIVFREGKLFVGIFRFSRGREMESVVADRVKRGMGFLPIRRDH